MLTRRSVLKALGVLIAGAAVPTTALRTIAAALPALVEDLGPLSKAEIEALTATLIFKIKPGVGACPGWLARRIRATWAPDQVDGLDAVGCAAVRAFIEQYGDEVVDLSHISRENMTSGR